MPLARADEESGAPLGPHSSLRPPAVPVRTGTGSAPRLADGVQLVGRYQGSGYREARYLIRTGSGQVLHVSRLLFLVAANLDGRRSAAEIAARVSGQYRRQLSAEGVDFLVEHKLRPLGLVAPAPVARHAGHPAQLLGLRLRRTFVPPGVVQMLGRALAPLFVPVVVAVGLAGLAVADLWLIRTASLMDSLQATLLDPPIILAVLGITVTAAFVHELGHAAACTYGGGRPGAIGVGLYLVYPAFYTDVTDSYRLDRAGRVRTDLGGVYFNALSLIGLTAAYQATGWEPLVLVIVLVHVEMGQQLLPVVRLDGYFVLADLVGVPDLFARVRPILASIPPGRPPDPRVDQLRRSTRIIVTIWVLTVVPLLLGLFGFLLLKAPEVLRDVWAAEQDQWDLLGAAVDADAWATAALAVLSLVLLALPVLGIALVLGGMVRRTVPPALRLVGRLYSRLAKRVEDIVNGPDHTEDRPVDPAGNGARPRPPHAAPTHAAPTHAASPHAASPRAASVRVASRPSPPRAERERAADEPAPESSRRFTADDFTEDVMLRPRSRPPTRGWRRAVYASTRGVVNPGPGAAERREQEVIERVRTRVRGARRIVVLSRKGGAGKTTTTLMLGHTFAAHRGDRVVALDANPDAGSLAYRVHRETPETVTSLLAGRSDLDRYSDMRAFTSQSPDTRLEVVASDDDPRISQALGERDYHQTIDLLDRHYNLILIDTGTGILDAGIQGILTEADQLVVVMPPALDGGRVAAMTLDWLDQHGRNDLVCSSVAVINAVHGRGAVELDRMEAHFAGRCAATVRIPWDPVLGAGAHTTLAELRRPTRDAYLELAAMVAEGFVASCRPGDADGAERSIGVRPGRPRPGCR